MPVKIRYPLECILMIMSMDEAISRMKARGGKGIPKVAYYCLRKKFQKPTLEEGCNIVIKFYPLIFFHFIF